MTDLKHSLARWSGLLGAGALLFAPAARAATADSLVQDGEAAEKDGNVDKAIESYTEALKTEAGNEGAALDLSVLYRRQDQLDKAINVLNQALQANPNSVRIANNLGVLYRLNKQYDAAETVLRAALSRAPGNIDTYKNMAVLFYDQDKLPLAEQFSLEAKKINDKDSGVWNNLGLIYYKKDGSDKPTRALAAFKHAVELNPKDETAWLNVGAISIRYRDYANAEKAFANAVNIDPVSYQNHLWHAYALDGSKKFDDALKEYDAAFAKKSDLVEVYYAKGMILQAQATGLGMTDAAFTKWGAAKEQCQKSLDTKPEDEAKVTKLKTCIQTADYFLSQKNKPQQSPIAQPPKPEEKKPEQKAPEAKPEEKATDKADEKKNGTSAKSDDKGDSEGAVAAAPKAAGAH